jgi:hypothetical protein
MEKNDEHFWLIEKTNLTTESTESTEKSERSEDKRVRGSEGEKVRR